ncbi:MAG TPA: 2-dehydropantoate 2-reductase [Terriglobia bacterium]|nr:2-dehydropantoate 2-reductase [Terriglobia bacterium]
MPVERIVVVGAGAVGCYFGGMLARAGTPVTLIGRAAHVDAINRNGLFLERSDFQAHIKVQADTRVEAVRDATIVLLSVKTTDTETAAAALAPHLGRDALLVSFQNGVDNAERIQRAIGIKAVPAVVYVAAAMTGPGRVKHNGRGDIVIGHLSRLESVFKNAEIPCRVSDNIAAELWTKLVMNCAYNAISALTRSHYLAIKENPLALTLMKELIREVVAVASASGIRIASPEELFETALKLGAAMSTATSSTEQDIARGRPTEIDSLNGYVARRGKELGIPTPINTALHALVKLLEAQARGDSISQNA